MRIVHSRAAIALICLLLSACADRAKVELPANESTAEKENPAHTLKVMEEAQRQLLWEIEHHGNILSRHGFSSLAGAIQKGDEKSLSGILAADFSGEWPVQPTEVSLDNDFLHVVRQRDDGHPPAKLNREQFIAKLMVYHHLFKHAIKGSKIALMKLRPTRDDDLDAPWEGTGQLRIWGERERCKPAEVIVYLKYQIVRPTKEAISQGKWLRSCAITQSQVGWSQSFLMRDVAAERGLEPQRLHDNWLLNQFNPFTGGVFVCDFDRDGILDVLVTDVNGYFLYQGQRDGKFKNRTVELGLPEIIAESSSRSLVAAWVDLDGDGWEDLILGPYIFQNQKGKRFRNVTPLCNLRLPPSAGGVAVADYDGDGRMDVYVFQPGTGKADSWIDGKAGTGTINRLWHNKGDWRFEDVTRITGTSGEERSTFTALWFDANNDNRPDLYVPNEFGDAVLYINQGNGTFRPASLTQAAGDFGTMGATCGDINNDGHIDLYCGNMYSKAGMRVIGNIRPGTYPENIMARMRTFVKGSELHLNRGDLRFEQKGQEWQVAEAGWAYGPALVDLDNDGWLDLYATCGYISRSRSEPDG